MSNFTNPKKMVPSGEGEDAVMLASVGDEWRHVSENIAAVMINHITDPDAHTDYAKFSFGETTQSAQILAGATQEIDITLSSEMPSTDYLPLVMIEATTSVLGSVHLQGVKQDSKTTTGFTVVIKNTGISIIAVGSVKVIGVALRAV